MQCPYDMSTDGQCVLSQCPKVVKTYCQAFNRCCLKAVSIVTRLMTMLQGESCKSRAFRSCYVLAGRRFFFFSGWAEGSWDSMVSTSTPTPRGDWTVSRLAPTSCADVISNGSRRVAQVGQVGIRREVKRQAV